MSGRARAADVERLYTTSKAGELLGTAKSCPDLVPAARHEREQRGTNGNENAPVGVVSAIGINAAFGVFCGRMHMMETATKIDAVLTLLRDTSGARNRLLSEDMAVAFVGGRDAFDAIVAKLSPVRHELGPRNARVCYFMSDVLSAANESRLRAAMGSARPVRFVGAEACVYFLMRGRRVVYVGQSTNLMARLGQHVRECRKAFTHARFVRVAASDMNDIESIYIRMLRPEYNAGASDGV